MFSRKVLRAMVSTVMAEYSGLMHLLKKVFFQRGAYGIYRNKLGAARHSLGNDGPGLPRGRDADMNPISHHSHLVTLRLQGLERSRAQARQDDLVPRDFDLQNVA